MQAYRADALYLPLAYRDAPALGQGELSCSRRVVRGCRARLRCGGSGVGTSGKQALKKAHGVERRKEDKPERYHPSMDFVSAWINGWLMELSTEAGLAGLFLSAFVSATLLPGGSEVLLFGWVQTHPEQRLLALLVTTAGNTLGGLTTYGCGRLLPQRAEARLAPRALVWLQRYGPVALLLSWLPVMGDAVCLAAGWLRLSLFASGVWMLLGKLLRYAAIVAV